MANGKSAPDEGGFANWGENNEYVGLVMQRTEEGEALARLLSEREEIELVFNDSFIEIRAKGRLVVPYAELEEELGIPIDGYWLQGEIATHIGGLVMRDRSLLLTHDPSELVTGMDEEELAAGA